jgi:hypothetical protein
MTKFHLDSLDITGATVIYTTMTGQEHVVRDETAMILWATQMDAGVSVQWPDGKTWHQSIDERRQARGIKPASQLDGDIL